MRICSKFLVVLFLLGACAVAQEPTPTAKISPPPGTDTTNAAFVGYMFEPTDWGPTKLNGLDANYTHFFGQRLGVVGDFDFAKAGNITDASAYAFRVGPRYNLLRRNRRVVPYVNLLIGGAHLSADVIYYPFPGETRKTWFGFTWAAGGGVDVALNKHLGARFQGDFTHLPFGDTDSSMWQRLAFGVTWKW